MVKSKLDNSIEYTESKKLDKDDINHNAIMYEIILNGHRIIIALGKPKYAYIDKNIEYYPIYLVKKNKVIYQIGLYELLSSTLPDSLDAEGDLNLELLYDPLLYSFVEKDSSIIENASLGIAKDDEIDEQIEREEEEEEDELINDAEKLVLKELTELNKTVITIMGDAS